MRSCGMLRNRMLADPTFLFKIGTEVCISTVLAELVGYALNPLQVYIKYNCVSLGENCIKTVLATLFWNFSESLANG